MADSCIYLDLPAVLESELFGNEELMRLHRLGRPVRSGDGVSRLKAEIVVTGWGSRELPERLADDDVTGLVVHSAGTIRRLIPKELLAAGLRVSQASAGMATSVAELALFMTLSELRGLRLIEQRLRQPEWGWSEAQRSRGLGQTVAGARIGVIGASRVGREYVRMVVACGARTSLYDPYITAADAAASGAQKIELDELLKTSDVVAMHAPVTAETRCMLDADRLALMPDGAIVVNTARAALIDRAALLAELRSGRLRAAMDVFDEEPLAADNELFRLPNVLLTPHIGALTTHSRRTQGRIVVDEIERYRAGLPLAHEVTTTSYDLVA